MSIDSQATCRDTESGNEYAGARYYSNVRGRWLSVDPVLGDEQNPQRLNRYGYVLNDPVNYVDPGGSLILLAPIVRNPIIWGPPKGGGKLRSPIAPDLPIRESRSGERPVITATTRRYRNILSTFLEVPGEDRLQSNCWKFFAPILDRLRAESQTLHFYDMETRGQPESADRHNLSGIRYNIC